jgi:hypothetical protein
MAPVYAVPRLLARNGLTCRTSTTTRSTKRSPRRCCARSRPGKTPTTARPAGLDAPLGSIDRSLNVKGSSLAAGHPFAATGGRIVANLAKLLDAAGKGGADFDLRCRRPGCHRNHRTLSAPRNAGDVRFCRSTPDHYKSGGLGYDRQRSIISAQCVHPQGSQVGNPSRSARIAV